MSPSCVQSFGKLTHCQRWLLEVNRDDEARAVVYKLHGADTPEERSAAEAEFAEMHDQIKADALGRSRSVRDLWATRPMLRRTLVAVGVQAFTQFTGINGESSGWKKLYGSLMHDKSSTILGHRYTKR